MNPWDLSASDLLVWGIVAHLIADWLLQNDWMAVNKAERRSPRVVARNGYGPPPFRWRPLIWSDLSEDLRWWDRHPAAYVHAGIHGALLALVFGWVAAPLALVHLLIDTRVPVACFSRLIRQTQPNPEPLPVLARVDPQRPIEAGDVERYLPVDLGMLVRFNVDQVWHVATIAAAALLVAA